MPWLDTLTGRVTMYRLVTISLAVIAVASILLSLVGQVAFEPAELLASLAAALLGTLGSNAVLGLVLRMRPHVESSVITGLLLFFLFFPTTNGAELGSIALAGALATLSKYVLAWRGRHIFNAAAAGAALIAVLQLNSAIWWVATGALLPLVLVGAFLVLHRTRRLLMGALFVVVAAGILTVRLTSGGQDVADSLLTAFTSYPVLFFAGFMLSEPLTLPPRRWQQLALAVLVGVLFTVPFTFPPVYLSFEAALLIGNLLAFLVGQRRGLRLSYVGNRQLTPTAYEFRFAPAHPVAFKPGQYIELTLPHARQDLRGSRRTFSIASPPTSGGELSVAMRVAEPSSSFKRTLLELDPGATVRATSVGGDFLLPRDRSKPVLLIASGIGVTPFLSQLGAEAAETSPRDIVLVYSVSAVDELAFTDVLASTRVLLIAPEVPDELAIGWRYLGAGPLTAELLRAEVPDAATRVSYVSGSPASVHRAKAVLRQVGAKRVQTDYFSGY